MNTQQLKTFIAVAEYGSFGKAEQPLFFSKQAIKKQIDALEKELKFSLFNRSQAGNSLTPAGTEFYRMVKKYLEEMDASIKRCQQIDHHDQVLRIENPNHPRLMLESAFSEFFHSHPYVRLQLILQERKYFAEDILNDKADIVECIYQEDLLKPGIRCQKLMPMPYRCLLSPYHPLSVRKTIYPEDLSGFHVGVLTRNRALIELLNQITPPISIEIMQSNSLQQIYNLCYNNGIFISKAYYVDTLDPLVIVPLETDIVSIGAVLYRDPPAPLTQEFLDFLQTFYKDSIAQLNV